MSKEALDPKPAVVLFTKYPEPGKAKTRMIPVLGEAAAAELQRAMTAHLIDTLRPNIDLLVRFTGRDAAAMTQLFGPSRYEPQGDGDLGQRLQRAASETLAEGRDQVIIIGADCPGVTPATLHGASALLRRYDTVLGPARDGGYYLVGLKQPQPALFNGIDWGTDAVLQQTLDAANAAGLSVALLPVMDDVDRPEDLPVWDTVRAST